MHPPPNHERELLADLTAGVGDELGEAAKEGSGGYKKTQQVRGLEHARFSTPVNYIGM